MDQQIISSNFRINYISGAARRLSWKIISVLVISTMLLPNFTFVIQEIRLVSIELRSAAAASLNQSENHLWKAWWQTADLTPTPTVTSTPTQVQTETLIPTPSPTVVPSVTSTLTPTMATTKTPTSEPTANLTPIITATPMVTPTVTIPPTIIFEPTPTAYTSETVSGVLTLYLSANPAFVNPGGQAFVDYEIIGWDTLPLGQEFNLRIQVPPGFVPHKSQDGEFDLETKTLSIEIQKDKGRTHWEVSEAFVGPYTIMGNLFVEEEILASATFQLEDHTTFVINKSGGHAYGLGGRGKVTFPEGALSEDIELEINKLDPTSKKIPYSLSGDPFELNAYSLNNGQEITQFATELIVEVAYDEDSIPWDERSLILKYFNEDTQTWITHPGWVDIENNIIVALINHFSIQDISSSNWQAATLPNLDNFQVSHFKSLS